MTPSRSTDAGPDGRRYCPRCDSDRWSTLTGCALCGDTVCSCCYGALSAGPGELICSDCVHSVSEWEITTLYHGVETTWYVGDLADAQKNARVLGTEITHARPRHFAPLRRITTTVRTPQVPEWQTDPREPFSDDPVDIDLEDL